MSGQQVSDDHTAPAPAPVAAAAAAAAAPGAAVTTTTTTTTTTTNPTTTILLPTPTTTTTTTTAAAVTTTSTTPTTPTSIHMNVLPQKKKKKKNHHFHTNNNHHHNQRRLLLMNIPRYDDAHKWRPFVQQWTAHVNQQQQQQQQQERLTTTTTTTPTPIIMVEVEKIKKPPKAQWMMLTLTHPDSVEPLMQYINHHNNNVNPNHTGDKDKEDDSLLLHHPLPRLPLPLPLPASCNKTSKWQSRRPLGIIAKRPGGCDHFHENENENEEEEGVEDRQGPRLSTKRQRQHHLVDAEEEEEPPQPCSLEQIKDAIIPLWRLSPAQQRQHKMRDLVKHCAIKITKECIRRCCNHNVRVPQKNQQKTLKAKHPPPQLLYDWLKPSSSSSQEATPTPVIRMEEIVPVPSPVRNKVEFTFGYRYVYKDHDKDNAAILQNQNHGPHEVVEKVPSVGVCAQGWDGGVSRPHGCAHIPSEAWAIVTVVEDFLQDCPFAPYDTTVTQDDTTGGGGVWRLLTIRISRRTRQVMIIVQHHSVPTADQTAGTLWEREKQRLIDLLVQAELPVVDLDLDPSTTTMIHDSLTTTTTTTTFPEIDYNTPTSLKVTSVFFQVYDGRSLPPPEHPVQHVFGMTSVTERVGPCTFHISPGAFFQVNTAGAERLYQIVHEQIIQDQNIVVAAGAAAAANTANTANTTTATPTATPTAAATASATATSNPPPAPPPTATPKLLLLDVCCGTGTIGISCLKAGIVQSVIGIDVAEPAIRDAERNAALNGLRHPDSSPPQVIAFYAGRAEDVLGNVLQERRRKKKQQPPWSSEEKVVVKEEEEEEEIMVAVVDPARDGLHPTVCQTLRQYARIRRIVYVSCNPTGSLVRDVALLCAPPSKRYGGTPFYVTRAIPVDLFPLTRHCEVVMTLDRLEM